MDARAGVRLEGDGARRVEPIDRVDEPEHACADEVVEVDAGRHAPGEAQRQVARKPDVRPDERIALARLHVGVRRRVAPHRSSTLEWLVPGVGEQPLCLQTNRIGGR